MSADLNRGRLTEVDALRGLAALAVVCFHYTRSFDEHFGRAVATTFSFPHGYFGVHLFFVISGFVIFMTLDRTRRPMDFIVSRFSRLFPAYWVAIALTFAITHLLGLPGKLVSAGTALGNLFMIHGLFGVPFVDGSYWTLEVELLFYFGMLMLYRFGCLHRIHQLLYALFALRLLYFAMSRLFGIDLPWIVYHLLLLEHLPWFALGISIHLLTEQRPGTRGQAPWWCAAFAVLTLLIVDSLFMATLAVSFATLTLCAARGRIAVLRSRLLIWLGAISYPLYLVHENIGWSILLRLSRLHISPDLAMLIALGIALLMAEALHRYVEVPAMDHIRNAYRDHDYCRQAS